MSERRSLMKVVGSISLATLVSRVLGLARDQVQSYYFGASWVTDAFLAAFRIPNLLRDLFAEGALSSAFIPTFTLERARGGDESAWRLANRVLTALFVVLSVLALAIALFAPWILKIYVGGFSPEKMSLAVAMTRILSPFLLFVALAAVAMGVLNTCGRYFLPALAPAAFNVAAILGVVLLVPLLRSLGAPTGMSLAIGAMAGGALQFLVQVPAMRREGFRFRPELAPTDPGLRRVIRLMLPATFGLAATQINILVDTVIASSLGDGPITWLSLAFRLMQLPIGLFGVAIATANLTQVSRDAAAGDHSGLRANLAKSLRAAALLTLPASAGLVALRVPIVQILFEHGRFTAESTASTAAAVLCYALGLYAYSVVKIQVPTFYALGDTRVPVIAAAASVVLKIGANLLLLSVLPRLGVQPFLALAISTSLAAWSNSILLAVGLRRRVGRLEGLGVGTLALQLLALSCVMGLSVGTLHAGLERAFPGGGFWGLMGRLAVAVACGVALTVGGTRYLGIPEGRALWDRLRRLAGSRGDA